MPGHRQTDGEEDASQRGALAPNRQPHHEQEEVPKGQEEPAFDALNDPMRDSPEDDRGHYEDDDGPGIHLEHAGNERHELRHHHGYSSRACSSCPFALSQALKASGVGSGATVFRSQVMK